MPKNYYNSSITMEGDSPSNTGYKLLAVFRNDSENEIGNQRFVSSMERFVMSVSGITSIVDVVLFKNGNSDYGLTLTPMGGDSIMSAAFSDGASIDVTVPNVRKGISFFLDEAKNKRETVSSEGSLSNLGLTASGGEYFVMAVKSRDSESGTPVYDVGMNWHERSS